MVKKACACGCGLKAIPIATMYRVVGNWPHPNSGGGWLMLYHWPHWPPRHVWTPSTSYTVWNFAWGDPCDD